MTTHIVFRVDASTQIGTGHVMRCLTLAHALKAEGASCHFVCRFHQGNLIEFIRSQGFSTHALPLTPTTSDDSTTLEPPPTLAHAAWLGATQAEDAVQCATILARLRPFWLIVDHYALDANWERRLKPFYRKLMVIDDLVDRPHAADLLLNQNFGRCATQYSSLVPNRCVTLAGSEFALLRPDFALLRDYSIARRKSPLLRNVLITMGGVDSANATSKVLTALRRSALPAACKITVVMGSGAPCLDEVRQLSLTMPWRTELKVAATNIAELMADADLAIGAAGATSWERCCLGVPSFVAALADNQRFSAQRLAEARAAFLLPICDRLPLTLAKAINDLVQRKNELAEMSRRAQQITDGKGTQRVQQWMRASSNQTNHPKSSYLPKLSPLPSSHASQ